MTMANDVTNDTIPAPESTPSPAEADQSDLHEATAALAIHDDRGFKLAFEPTDLAQAIELAKILAPTGLCGVKTPAEVLVRVLTGRSLGLGTMQSMRGVYSIEGRPSLEASLMHALCIQSPVCEEFRCIETTDKVATYRVKRRGQPADEISFTLEEAIQAGLRGRGEDKGTASKNNWNAWPRAMLRARAKSNAARMIFPDVVMGMYSREELHDGLAPAPYDGEVVHRAPPQVATAHRDFAAELGNIANEIQAASNGAAMRAVRERITAWDGPAELRTRAQSAYDARAAALKAQGPAKPAGTQEGPATGHGEGA